MKKLMIVLLLSVVGCVSSYSQTKILSMFINKTDTIIIRQDTLHLNRSWIVPDDVKLQYAGNIGFLAIGASYHFSKDKYHMSIMYGYLPQSSGYSDISTLSIKNTFYIKHFKYKHFTLSPTAGISVNWGYTKNTFEELPEYYPEKYYFQNKIHLAPFIGFRMLSNKINKKGNKLGVYTELGTLDAYLLECIRTDYVKTKDILNLAIGFSYYF